MNPLGLVLCIVCAFAVLTVPRRWAFVPLLIGSCFITAGQALHIGFISFPVYRLLLAVGLLRIMLKKEHLVGGYTPMDKLLLVWCLWTMFASIFQPWGRGSGPEYVGSVVSTVATAYFVPRALCRDTEDVKRLLRTLCLIMAPIAIAMLYEKFSSYNIFSVFGRVPEIPGTRDGQIRAQGPFSHPILAGTIGAACFPFAVLLWREYRKTALIGAIACIVIVFASASSGPIMAILLGIFALGMWRYRQHCGRLRKLAVLTYLLLIPIMNQPPYYLIAKINLTGSSTGWHRAYLINRTIAHFSEWALFGTNRTRHWMPLQGHISETQTDITNYYIAFAVLGGFLCMALVIWILWKAFMAVGEYVRHATTTPEQAFTVWCLGASLFSHAMSSLSVAYFGQLPVFFWITVALIASMRAGLGEKTAPVPAAAPKAKPAAHGVPSVVTFPAPSLPYARVLTPSRSPASTKP